MVLDKKYNPVKIEGSTQILEVGYLESERKMLVVFLGKSVYEYVPVERKQYEAMIESSSVGGYFNKHIRKDKSIVYKPYRG